MQLSLGQAHDIGGHYSDQQWYQLEFIKSHSQFFSEIDKNLDEILAGKLSKSYIRA